MSETKSGLYWPNAFALYLLQTMENTIGKTELSSLLSCGFPSPDFKPAKLGGRKPISEVVKWDSWT